MAAIILRIAESDIMPEPTNLLLTGTPGCGKTTAVMRTIELLSEVAVAGFYTVEQRDESGRRTGFDAVTLDGEREPLARAGLKAKRRVGKYGVVLDRFESLLDKAFGRAEQAELFVVDEIGKMECFSNKFVELVRELLASRKPLLGTVALRGSGFIAEVKRRQDVELIRVDSSNRDALPAQLAARIRESLERTA